MNDFKNSDYYKSGRILENAKVGIEKAKEKNKELKNKRIMEYLNHRNLCGYCQQSLDYEKRKNKFCSNSCSAKSSNTNRELSESTKTKISSKLIGKEKNEKTRKKLKEKALKRFENVDEKKKISNSLLKFWKDNTEYKDNLKT